METVEARDIPLSVRAHRLTRVYRRGSEIVSALSGIDLDVPHGAFVAITGPSGCGKTTLLHLLSGIDRPDSGVIWLDGAILTDLGEAQLARMRRRRMGLVFQSFNLLAHMNILENIMLPALIAGSSRRDARLRASSLLDSLGLATAAPRLPSELSGGQQQRVAIARALINSPAVLFADEPTGNLDSAAGQDVMQLFSRFHQRGQTIVLVTHDPQIAARAEKIIVMRDGHIVDVAHGRGVIDARHTLNPAPLSSHNWMNPRADS